MSRTEHASIRIERESARAVFDLITDIHRLTAWNRNITRVDGPAQLRRPGQIWHVRILQGPLSWVSTSTLVTIDADARTYTYRSGTDDDNPSFTEWTWSVRQAGHVAVVEVDWRLFPQTRLRRWVLAPIRRTQLRTEVAASLERLVDALHDTRRGPAQ